MLWSVSGVGVRGHVPDAPPIDQHKPMEPPRLRLLAIPHNDFNSGADLVLLLFVHLRDL